jgi:hypothetical protein
MRHICCPYKQRKMLLLEDIWSSSDTINILTKGYSRNHKKSRIWLTLLRSDGLAIAHAFIRWFLIAEVCVQYQVSPCWLFGRQSGNGTDFLRIFLSSPCHLTIHYCSFLSSVAQGWPPLWSSGQSFWLQIQRSRVRFLATTEELLEWRSSGSGLENRD